MVTNAELLERHSVSVRARALIEIKIVRKILGCCKTAGYSIDIPQYDDEPTPDDDSVLRACFNLDEAHLVLKKDGKRVGWIFLVFGNSGYDLVSDYTTNIEEFMKPILEYSEKLELAGGEG